MTRIAATSGCCWCCKTMQGPAALANQLSSSMWRFALSKGLSQVCTQADLNHTTNYPPQMQRSELIEGCIPLGNKKQLIDPTKLCPGAKCKQACWIVCIRACRLGHASACASPPAISGLLRKLYITILDSCCHSLHISLSPSPNPRYPTLTAQCMVRSCAGPL